MENQKFDFGHSFHWAIIRLATYVSESSSQSRLLFGSVSLITKDRPRPSTSKGVEHYKVRKGNKGKVFFRGTVLTAAKAIEWYRQVGVGGIQTPVPSNKEEIDNELDAISLVPTFFEDDPPWPSLGIPLGTDLFSNAGGPGDPAPFRGSGSPRIHRRFGDNTGFESVCSDKHVVSFLKRRLHIDLSDYQEYLGGLVLIVPDPILRYIQHLKVSEQEDKTSERLVLRLVPRPDQNITDLKLTVIERRSNLLSRFNTVDVPSDGIVTVESRLSFEKTGYVISHPTQGIIAYQQPVPFFRRIEMNVGIVGRQVNIKAPISDSPYSSIDSYEVLENTHEFQIGVGEKRHDAVTRVIEAEQRRIRRASAKQFKQTWFDQGERKRAIAFLREQMASARKRVMVADPYFGANQILQFLHAVPRIHIEFMILTSRLAFEKDETPDVVPTNEAIRSKSAEIGERLTRFRNALGTLQKRGMKSVIVHVLTGKSPSLHDRFLVIDNEVLFLGNSLNSLGERASLILKVPDSEPILEKLNGMADLSEPFENYFKNRLQSSMSYSEES